MRFQWIGGPDSQAVRADLGYGRDLVVAQQPTHALVDLAGRPPFEMQAMLWLGRKLMRFQMQVFESVSSALDWLTQGEVGTMHRLQTEWHEHTPRAGQPAAGVCNPQPGPERSFGSQ